MKTFDLKELLSPYSHGEFLEEYWGQKFFVLNGPSNKFDQLFDWSALNSILEHHRLDAPRLRLELKGRTRQDLTFILQHTARRGGQIPRINVPRLYSLLRSGATLVIDAVDEMHATLRDLSENISSFLGHRIQINAYVSCGDMPGFGMHWDDHDVFILQLSGRKRWKIFGPTRPYPMYRDIQPDEEIAPQGDPIWNGVIEPGGVIYIPRGHWHDVVGINEPTLHLTVGSTNPTGVDLLSWLVDQLRDEEEFRKDLPLFSQGDECVDHCTRLKNALDHRWGEDLISRYLAHRRQVLAFRPHICLPHAIYQENSKLPSDYSVQLCANGEINCGVICGADHITIAADGRRWVFNDMILPVIQLILSGKPHNFSTLLEAVASQGVSRESLQNLIVELLVGGFVQIRELQKED